MRKIKKILCFFGTRPEAIKMAPVVNELKRHRDLEPVIVVSAQHRGMLDQVLSQFGLTAEADLNLMRANQTLTDVTVGVIKNFEPVLEKMKPDMVLVHGDTTTTFGGALAAFYKKIPVGHVEAGLRTLDRYQPFPEELNRRLTDTLCSLYFAPTPQSAKHLHLERHNKTYTFVTGNTVIDALLYTVRSRFSYQNKKLGSLMKTLKSKKIILLTAHRRENFGRPFEMAFNAIRDLAVRFADVHWVYAVHPNPHVQKPAHRILGRQNNIHLFDPLDYSDLVNVMAASTLVVTDSGGIQEEAPSLGKPVLVMRDVTERPEAVRAGTVRLVGTNPQKIMHYTSELLTNARAYSRMANAVNPYGDGQASKRIVQAIRFYFGLAHKKPENFIGY